MDFSSLYTEKSYALDITGHKAKGRTIEEKADDLDKYINQEVKATQSVVVRAYPDKLKMTVKQYRTLAKQESMLHQEWEGQEYYLYRTKYNIMEIEIV